MNQIIEAIFNGKVFCPTIPITLEKNTKVTIVIESKEKQNLQKLSTDLLLPEIDENDLIFVRDKDNGRDIDL
jgi:predicted DNA-binding antitoxin AbrB/MazE fold protein